MKGTRAVIFGSITNIIQKRVSVKNIKKRLKLIKINVFYFLIVGNNTNQTHIAELYSLFGIERENMPKGTIQLRFLMKINISKYMSKYISKYISKTLT